MKHFNLENMIIVLENNFEVNQKKKKIRKKMVEGREGGQWKRNNQIKFQKKKVKIK